MTLIESFEQLPDGKKWMASARLRRGIIKALHDSLDKSELTQSDLARALGKSRSAIGQVFNGDGNLKIETISEYFFAMGAELQLTLRPIEKSTFSVYKGWEPIKVSLSTTSPTLTGGTQDSSQIRFTSPPRTRSTGMPALRLVDNQGAAA